MRPDQFLAEQLRITPLMEEVPKTKRAIQVRVGDNTELLGMITDVLVHPTGDAVDLMGTKDRATVWKNTLIKMSSSKGTQ
jgi:hypothetical protein